MELQMRTHDWSRRAPDWLAAAVAGLVAGAVLMVLELAWSASMAESPWRIPRMVAALVMGDQTLEPATFSLGVVTLALFIHYLLGVLFGLSIGFIIAGFHY